VLAGLASIFGAFQPANVTPTRFRLTLPQLAISVTEDKKYNSQWQPNLWHILKAEKADVIRNEDVLGIRHVGRAE
jgi:hypothetical protein